MAQIRNVSDDDRTIVYGVRSAVTVPPDGLVTVDDDALAAYVSQTAVWAEVQPPPPVKPLPPVAPPAD